MKTIAKNKISDNFNYPVENKNTVYLKEDDQLEYTVLINNDEVYATMEYDDAVIAYCQTRNEEIEKASQWDGIQ